MTTGPVLILPDLQKSFEVYCDACGRSLGEVLMQEGRVIAYESQMFSKPEMTAQIYEKELLAVIHALTQWRHYLLGADFTVFTDHQSLRYFLSQKQLSEKQMRWANILSQFHFQIDHVQGQKNVVADALSRKPLVQAISAIHHSTSEDMPLGKSSDYMACHRRGSPTEIPDLRVCFGRQFGRTLARGCSSRPHSTRRLTGQPEIANSVFLDLLKSYFSDQKTQWERCLPLVEFAYNNTIHSSTGKAPFEIVEGAMKQKGKEELSMRYYGPFQITKQINDISFRLRLPDTWKIHNVFHVNLWKKKTFGDVPDDGEPDEQPEVEANEEILVPEQELKDEMSAAFSSE
ncbi:hypothetical protein L7F22_030313 [Adiantum nelumboides]|nr:hypothetical protein [Adiantum nelumboides]